MANQMSEEKVRLIVRQEIFNLVTDLNNPHAAASVQTSPPAEPPKRVQKERKVAALEDKLIGPDAVPVGQLVQNRFKVSSPIITGGFGQTYEAVDTTNNREVNVHVEKLPLSEFLDVQILTALQGKQHYPVLISSGSTDSFAFMVTRVLGRNLSEIRHSCPLKPARLSESAAYRCTLQCIQTIESLHSVGYIHRDPKPSNFAVGKEPSDQGTIYLIDFGLCHKYADENGSVLPSGSHVGFRGTVRYASLAAHEHKELSRRDDLWSLFYMFCELLTGQLPWRKTNDKKAVAKLKTTYSPEVLSERFRRKWQNTFV